MTEKEEKQTAADSDSARFEAEVRDGFVFEDKGEKPRFLRLRKQQKAVYEEPDEGEGPDFATVAIFVIRVVTAIILLLFMVTTIRFLF